jgi:hypothetical protein
MHDNVATILLELVGVAYTSPFGLSSPLSKTLLSDETCATLVTISTSNGDSALQHGLSVVNQIILLCRHNQSYDDDADLAGLPQIIPHVLEKIEYFKSVLLASNTVWIDTRKNTMVSQCSPETDPHGVLQRCRNLYKSLALVLRYHHSESADCASWNSSVR